jgi:hypothetical protein
MKQSNQLADENFNLKKKMVPASQNVKKQNFHLRIQTSSLLNQLKRKNLHSDWLDLGQTLQCQVGLKLIIN